MERTSQNTTDNQPVTTLAEPRNKGAALALYLVLAGLFISALVTCNLVANKFITIDLGFKVFTISAGVLPYPLTFLITDFLSEIYGRKKTGLVVMSGFGALALTMLVLWLAKNFDAIPNSPVSDEQYDLIFGNSWRVILSSMTAYLFAQLADVQLFHFWKRLTKGKHLWLRNNASTILSQLVDTTLVVCVLFLGVLPFNKILHYILDGWQFKVLCALVDTPIIYLAAWLGRRRFGLSKNQEIKLL